MLSKRSKIYVAGHRGLVGSAILRSLKKNGYNNLIFKTSKELDLRDQKKVLNFLKIHKPDFIFIAAAKVGGIFSNNNYKANFIYDNLAIQTNLIHSAFLSGVKNLIFLGSSCVFPRNCKQPIKEKYLLTGELEKTNDAYAIAKIAGIKMCQSFNKQYNTDFRAIMPTNLYGPNDNYDPPNSHVLAALTKKILIAKKQNKKTVTIWGNGEPKREFLHVDDLAEASVFTLERFQFGLNDCSFLNVGTGKDISILDLAILIKDKVGFKGSIFWDKTKPNGTPLKRLDITRIKKLGWESKISLEEGIEKTIKDFKKIYI